MHLTGLGGSVPEEVMEVVEDHLWDTDPETIWISIQKILTRFGMARYFNRVGYILTQLYQPMIVMPRHGVRSVY